MNFALFLVIATFVSGITALINHFYLKKHRTHKKIYHRWINNISSFFPIFLTVLILRSFLIEPFRIPSGSLEPTLQVGDFVAVSKFSYGVRLPVIENKIISVSSPKIGDVAVFRWPPAPKYDFIKRVIGTPGDKISYHNKVLTINGKQMPQTFVENTTDESSGLPVSKYEEVLNGVKHYIYVRDDIESFDFDITVPEKAYFMMGDNRDNSADSRYWGFVDESYLRGKAFIVWMSWNGYKDTIRWSHIGKLIH